MRLFLLPRLSPLILLLVLSGIMTYAIIHLLSTRQMSLDHKLETPSRTRHLGAPSAKGVSQSPVRLPYFRESHGSGEVETRPRPSRRRVRRHDKALRLPEVKLRAIPVKELTEKLETVRSSADLVRLFLDRELTDQQIHTWVKLYAVRSNYGSDTNRKPRQRFIRAVQDGPSEALHDVFVNIEDSKQDNKNESHMMLNQTTGKSEAGGMKYKTIPGEISGSLLISENKIQSTKTFDTKEMSSTAVLERFPSTLNNFDTMLWSKVSKKISSSETAKVLHTSNAQSSSIMHFQNVSSPTAGDSSTSSQTNAMPELSTSYPNLAADSLNGIENVELLSTSSQPNATPLYSTGVSNTVTDTQSFRGSFATSHSIHEKALKSSMIKDGFSIMPQLLTSSVQKMSTAAEALPKQTITPTKTLKSGSSNQKYPNTPFKVNSTFQEVSINSSTADNLTKSSLTLNSTTPNNSKKTSNDNSYKIEIYNVTRGITSGTAPFLTSTDKTTRAAWKGRKIVTSRPKITRKHGTRRPYVPQSVADRMIPDELAKTPDEYNRERIQKGFLAESDEAFAAAFYHLDGGYNHDDYSCRQPQKFVERVVLPVFASIRIWPNCVLLHRCLPSSGCCPPTMTCGPKKIDVVHIPFMVFTIYDLRAHLEPTEAFFFSFFNHTECICQMVEDIPRFEGCQKLCPAPFQSAIVGPFCLCDCLSNGQSDEEYCKEIKGGARTLPKIGTECIRSGKCYPPLCEVGDFNVSTSYCPLSDDYALPASFFGHNPSLHRHYRVHLRLRPRPTTVPPSSVNASLTNSTATVGNSTSQDGTNCRESSSEGCTTAPTIIKSKTNLQVTGNDGLKNENPTTLAPKTATRQLPAVEDSGRRPALDAPQAFQLQQSTTEKSTSVETPGDFPDFSEPTPNPEEGDYYSDEGDGDDDELPYYSEKKLEEIYSRLHSSEIPSSSQTHDDQS